MHNRIFLDPVAEAQHRRGLLGAHFDCFVTWMQERGYSLRIMQDYVRFVTHFGKYLKRRGIHDIHRLEGVEGHKLVVIYRRYWENKGHNDKNLFFAISLYIRVLEETGILRNSPPRDSSLFHETEQYVTFLKDQKGLSTSTIYYHRYWVDKFLRFLGCKNTASTLPSFGITHVDRFIEQESVRLKRNTQHKLIVALRSFFRFLYQSEKLTTDLSCLITVPRRYRLESLPRVLSWDKIQKVLDSVDCSTGMDLRDYAILILLSSYGLRAGEVVRLRFEDVDWRKEIIHIVPGKTGKDLYLPLLPTVGKAILEYLKRGRPPSKYREFFLSEHAPKSPLSAANITRVVNQYIKLAGLSLPRQGAHLIRHSFATHLNRSGVPFKQISDLLGHRDPESTHLYTKTATEKLREVALEVPEEVKRWKRKQ